MGFTVNAYVLYGGYRVHICACFLVKNRVGSSTRMNREKSVIRHGGNILGKNACGVDNDFRMNNASVGGNAYDVMLRHLHGEHGGVKTYLRAVLNGVFGIGYGESVRANTACTRIIHCEFCFRCEVRLAAHKLLARDYLGVLYAVVMLPPKSIQTDKRLQRGVAEKHVLTYLLKRNVKLAANVCIHMVCAANVLVLERAFAEVDSGVHLAVVASRRLKCKVCLLVYK